MQGHQIRIAARTTLMLVVLSTAGTASPAAHAEEPHGAELVSESTNHEGTTLVRLLPALVQSNSQRIDDLERRIQQLEIARTSQSATGVSGEATAGPLSATEKLASGTEVTVGGQYRIMFNAANFGFHQAFVTDEPDSQSFSNQRFRTWLTIRTNDRVLAYLQAEMGHIVWGQDLDFPKAFVGPRFPAGTGLDFVGVELRRGYLQYDSEVGTFRVGIQDWQDPFKQTLASSDWDFNVGGISWRAPIYVFSPARLLAGWFVLFEGDPTKADDAMLWTLDVDWEHNDNSGLGLSIYALTDRGGYSYPTAPPYDFAWDLWLGARYHSATPLPWRAFALLNTGKRNELGGLPDFEHTGFATAVELGPIAFGPGKTRVQVLYSSGGTPGDRSSGEFRTIAQSARDNFGAQGYWSYLVIAAPHGPSDVNDLGVSLQNRGLGLFTIQAAYDIELTDSLLLTLACGWLYADEPNPLNGSRNMGVEFASMARQDLGGGLFLDFGAALFLTGDFYRQTPAGPDPDELYELFSRLQLEF